MPEQTTVEKAPAKKLDAPQQRSYFDFNKLNRFVLDDKVSFIEHKPLDEGLYESYQDLSSKIKLDRTGETTEVDMLLGSTRRFLLENLVTSWNLVDENGNAIPYSPKRLMELPPHIIGAVVEDIYKQNTILGSGEEQVEEGKG